MARPKFKAKPALLAGFALAAAAIFFANSLRTDASFNALADDYIDKFYFPNNPSLATSAGIHLYDDKIEDFSKETLARDIDQLQHYQEQFEALDSQKLSQHYQADLELVLNNIRSQLLSLQKIQAYTKNPDLYSSALTNAAFVIMERQFASPEKRLTSLIAREKQMPTILDEARQNLNNPPRIYTEIALEQLPGMIRFFEKDVPAAFKEVKDTELLKQFKVSNTAVIEALKAYQVWIKTSLLSHSNGDFRLGAETFRKKVLYDEMVDLPLDQLLSIGIENRKYNEAELIQLAKEIDPRKTPTEVLQLIAKDSPSPDRLLATFDASLDHLVRFIEQKNLITIPSKVRPILEETPPFMRAITFASMDIPGPFENVATEAYFNVTLPEKNWSSEKTRDFMAQFNYPVISSISVHEAYPGHYVQFLWVRKNKDRIRKIFGAASNSEGWAHYCEQMMLDEGLGQDRGTKEAKLLRLGYLQEALLRNARYIVGIKMHTGQMSFKEAQDFFVQQAYQTKTVALVETKRGTLDPTYLVYTLGKLQILKLREDWKKQQGSSYSLEHFHNDFMRQGFPPIKIVRKAMLQDDSPTL